jgi:hypothetical protein
VEVPWWWAVRFPGEEEADGDFGDGGDVEVHRIAGEQPAGSDEGSRLAVEGDGAVGAWDDGGILSRAGRYVPSPGDACCRRRW